VLSPPQKSKNSDFSFFVQKIHILIRLDIFCQTLWNCKEGITAELLQNNRMYISIHHPEILMISRSIFFGKSYFWRFSGISNTKQVKNEKWHKLPKNDPMGLIFGLKM
jgi:hypothetical protein